ncbi:MAG: biopolymer transporter ExbD [Saprospiraceae bacterium]|nr:biopolymer transporter ExbD [Saprospiraceae bacterium]
MKTIRNTHKEITAGSMADIAFLLLIFFLVATTINEDKGLLVRLPEFTNDPPPPMPVRERNIFGVLVNAENHLMVRGASMNITELRENVKLFIQNPVHDPKMSENPKQAIISLRNDRGTSYQTYIQVYNELIAAYHELWDEMSWNQYKKSFSELSADQQKGIKQVIPLVISEAEPTEYGSEK